MIGTSFLLLFLTLSIGTTVLADDGSTSPTATTQHKPHHNLKLSPYHPSDFRPPLSEYQQNSSLSWCNPDNLALEDASKQGEWYVLPDGSLRYELQHCRLRRFTTTMAKHCLQGQHIVFMGDSLSRYLYLSLAYFLTYNHWAKRFCQVYHGDSVPKSFLNEKDFKSWALFYHESNALLNRRYPYAMEICDCFRDDRLSWNGPPESSQETNCYENRHFRAVGNGKRARHKDITPSNSGQPTLFVDGDDDVRLSYIQWYGLMPMRGHRAITSNIPPTSKKFTNVASTTTSTSSPITPMAAFKEYASRLNERICPVPEGERFHPLSKNCSLNRADLIEWDFPDFFTQNICKNETTIDDEQDSCQQFEREVLQPLETTHLVMNIGWHSGLHHGNKHFLDKVTKAAKKYFHEGTLKITKDGNIAPAIHLPKVTWRSVTDGAAFTGFDYIAKDFHKLHGKHTLGFFDVLGMTTQLRIIQNAIEANDHNAVRQLVKPSIWWPVDKEINANTVLKMWILHILNHGSIRRFTKCFLTRSVHYRAALQSINNEAQLEVGLFYILYQDLLCCML